MSQSRMLEIARVVQPHEQLSYTGTGPGLSFVTGSWVEMLVFSIYLFSLSCLADEVIFQLNTRGALSSERYTATYVYISGSWDTRAPY